MFALILLTFLLIFLLDYLTKRRRYKLTKNILGPPIIPIIGSHLFLKHTKTQAFVEDILKVNDRTSRIWIGQQLLIVTYDPKDIEIILTDIKHNRKNIFYDMFRSWFGDGVFLSADQKWIERRKILRPALKFQRWEGYTKICDDQCKILVKKLKAYDGKGAFNVQPDIKAAMLDMIGEASMGVKLNAQENATSKYLQAMQTISEIMTKRISSIYFTLDVVFQILSPILAKRQAKGIRTLQEFTRNTINEHIRQSETKNRDDLSKNQARCLLDIMMDPTNDECPPLSIEELRGEIDGAMFAGHHTQACSIPFTLYCISRHPDIQDRVFSEIREIFGDDKNSPLDLKKIHQLEYMDLVIKEALRFFSPAPMIGRQITEDTMINGKCYPSGTAVIIPIYRLHQDPEFFPDPDKFWPERHAGSRLNAFTHIPFSAGPRNCLGKKLATMEMKAVISKILRHFELLPQGAEPKLEFGITLRSQNGINLGLRSRVYKTV